MLRFLIICLPVAAVVGAGAYVAQDRAVLAQIGLAPAHGELRALSEPRRSAPTRPHGIRQGGPVCYDVPLWPSAYPLLPVWPGYESPLYGNPGAFTGVYGDGPLILASPTPVSLFPVGDYGRSVYDAVTPAGHTPGQSGPTPVPEPGSLAVFLVGLAGLWVLKGRRV